MPIIKQVAQSYADNSQATFNKMIELVDANVAKQVGHYEQLFDDQSMKIRELERHNWDLLQTLEEERHQHAEQLIQEREKEAKVQEIWLEEQKQILLDKEEE